MTQEALKLANEVMKAACKQIDELKAENKALKEALAVDKKSLTTETQTEQEPVAWEQFYPDLGKPQLEMRVEGPRHVVCQCDKCKAQPEQNFCSRCGKRVGGIDSIHTCTPPMQMNT